MTTPIDFESINRAALATARSLLPNLIADGVFRSLEYVVKNPCCDDRKAVSFTVNYKTGIWKDFGSGEGCDFVSLVAYRHSCSQDDAARELADKLGVPPYKPNGIAALKPNGLNGQQNGAAPLTAPEVISGVKMDRRASLMKSDGTYIGTSTT